jgi:septal ring factor EnvC (AmiA/AmiB activator)
VTDKEAKAEYAKKYDGKDGYSPHSDMMSAGSTISSVSPFPFVDPPTPPVMTTSFAALVKASVGCAVVEDIVDQTDDEMSKIMDEMLLIRKDIAVKNRRVVEIKEQMKKLTDELSIAEAEEKSGKTRLKELAFQIANIEG